MGDTSKFYEGPCKPTFNTFPELFECHGRIGTNGPNEVNCEKKTTTGKECTNECNPECYSDQDTSDTDDNIEQEVTANECTCSHGTAATGDACTTDGAEICVGCDEGYIAAVGTCFPDRSQPEKEDDENEEGTNEEQHEESPSSECGVKPECNPDLECVGEKIPGEKKEGCPWPETCDSCDEQGEKQDAAPLVPPPSPVTEKEEDENEEDANEEAANEEDENSSVEPEKAPAPCPRGGVNPGSCECGTTTTTDTNGCTITTCKTVCPGSCECPCGVKNNGNCKTSHGSGKSKKKCNPGILDSSKKSDKGKAKCAQGNNLKSVCESLKNHKGETFCEFKPEVTP